MKVSSISHLSLGFILAVLQLVVAILHEKTRRNVAPRWLYGVSGASAFIGSELCFCKGGCPKTFRVHGTGDGLPLFDHHF